MSETRSFTIEKADLKTFVPGRFEGKTPRAAAQKAGRRLFQQLEAQASASSTTSKKEEVKFTLRETTRGSAGKEYTYIAVKHELDEPVMVERAGVKITISHAYKVRSCQV